MKEEDESMGRMRNYLMLCVVVAIAMVGTLLLKVDVYADDIPEIAVDGSVSGNMKGVSEQKYVFTPAEDGEYAVRLDTERFADMEVRSDAGSKLDYEYNISTGNQDTTMQIYRFKLKKGTTYSIVITRGEYHDVGAYKLTVKKMRKPASAALSMYRTVFVGGSGKVHAGEYMQAVVTYDDGLKYTQNKFCFDKFYDDYGYLYELYYADAGEKWNAHKGACPGGKVGAKRTISLGYGSRQMGKIDISFTTIDKAPLSSVKLGDNSIIPDCYYKIKFDHDGEAIITEIGQTSNSGEYKIYEYVNKKLKQINDHQWSCLEKGKTYYLITDQSWLDHATDIFGRKINIQEHKYQMLNVGDNSVTLVKDVPEKVMTLTANKDGYYTLYSTTKYKLTLMGQNNSYDWDDARNLDIVYGDGSGYGYRGKNHNTQYWVIKVKKGDKYVLSMHEENNSGGTLTLTLSNLNWITDHDTGNLPPQIYKSRPGEDGVITYTCINCGFVAKETYIPAIGKYKLQYTKCSYDGKEKKPRVVVKNRKGKVIPASNYDVIYKNNKYVGDATVIIKFKGKKYTGCLVTSFFIGPSSTKLSNVSEGIKVAWSPICDSSRYTIYRKEKDGNYVKIKTLYGVDNSVYIDRSKHKNGARYTYKIVYKSSYIDYVSSIICYISRPTIKSLSSNGKNMIKVRYGKNAKARGYEIQYCSKQNMKGAVKVVVGNNSTTAKNITKYIAKGKTYYVRVRSYNIDAGRKYYSSWSKVKTVKVGR